MAARLTPEQKALRTITEAQWQRTVQDIAIASGWAFYHAPDNRPIVSKGGRRYVQNIRAGYPDLTLVRGTRLIYAELKRETGKTTEEQDVWLQRFALAGAETYVWRPSDLEDVKKTLSPGWLR